MKTFYYLIVLHALYLSACNKIYIEPNLPAETQTGANTFGCKVNGKKWIPKAWFVFNMGASWYNGSFRIWEVRYTNTPKVDQQISIRVESVNGTGSYVLNKIHHVQFRNQLNSCDYNTDSLNTGHLIITKLDTINKIISGRFDFKVKQAGCPDIEVSEGRFDYNYH